jgi:ABC-type sugar transport systems, permease components
VFIRRRRLTPYALLLPSAIAIGLLLFWPTIQIAEFSLQNYGLPQVTGVAPTQWVGGANFSRPSCPTRSSGCPCGSA